MASYPYSQETGGCFITPTSQAQFKELLEQTRPALEEMATSFKEIPLFKALYTPEDFKFYQNLSDRLQDDFTDLVILGTGGSSLGAQAYYYGLLDHGFGPAADCPRLHFLETTEPEALLVLLRHLKLQNTGVIVVSKSGSTTETLAQFLFFLKTWEEALGDAALSQHFLVITEPTPNPLRQIAENKKIQCLACDPQVGGRFSAFSYSSLLPVMAAGLDIGALFKGARDVLELSLKTTALGDSQPAIGAALQVMSLLHLKRPLTVMMPYTKYLERFTQWHRQLWAESIGKEQNGSTPIPALGPLDQHSQLQLYLDGPSDKFFSLFLVKNNLKAPVIKPILGVPEEISYLLEKTAEEVLNAQYKATYESLKGRQIPIRQFTLEKLSEKEFGGLLMHFILETLLAANLLKINAFDQPAVEESKLLTKHYLKNLKQ